MITITNHREQMTPYFDHGEWTPAEVTVEDAIISMIKFEFSYGGQVVEFTKDRLVVQTRVVNKLDTVTYTGPEVEMKELIGAAALWAKSCECDDMDKLADQLCEVTGGVPFYISLAAPMLIGQQRVKRMIALTLGLTELPKELLEMNESEIAAIAALVREGCSFQEAMEVAR